MKKDMIFFGEKGLTMTSANYIANQCKNLYLQLEKKLENVRFYNTTMSLLGSSQREIICKGDTDVSNIIPFLDKIAKLKSLIAWLREALKAKERLLKEANNLTFSDFGIEVPERPMSEPSITEDDVLSTWDVKQRNRYYYIETLCSQIGKYIHPGGTFAQAREAVYNYINNPNKVVGDGRDTVIYHYEASLDTTIMEELYMKLQDTYRSYQADLNSMKHDIQTALEKDRMEKDLKFQEAYSNYEVHMSELSSKLKVLKNDEISKVQALKIIIPDSLRSIYDEVAKLGK
jgi:hypothetical protein